MTVVDLDFRVQGDRIPADHEDLLFSAICGLLPQLRPDDYLGIFPIIGLPSGPGEIMLTLTSRLSFRVAREHIPMLVSLTGKVLDLGGQRVLIDDGVPEMHDLVPATRLYSRLVVIKGFMEPDAFLNAVQRQLDILGIKGKPSLVSGSHSPFRHRTLHIRDKEIVGFAVSVEELTADESIRLQEQGLGGRRRFGCGMFMPDQRLTDNH